MMFDFIQAIKEYVGKPVRMEFIVGASNYCWIGTIKNLHNNDRALTFEHSKKERQRMSIKSSELNLESAEIWTIDLIDDDEVERQSKTKKVVNTIACPHCNEPIHIVERASDKEMEVEPSEDEPPLHARHSPAALEEEDE